MRYPREVEIKDFRLDPRQLPLFGKRQLQKDRVVYDQHARKSSAEKAITGNGRGRTSIESASGLLKTALLNAEKMIATNGFSYVLRHPDGREIVYDPHGLFAQKKKKRVYAEGIRTGELTEYVRPFIESLKHVGDVAVIPAGKYELKRIRSVASSVAGNTFGTAKDNGGTTTHSTCMNHKTNAVEVMLHIDMEKDDDFMNQRVESDLSEDAQADTDNQ